MNSICAAGHKAFSLKHRTEHGRCQVTFPTLPHKPSVAPHCNRDGGAPWTWLVLRSTASRFLFLEPVRLVFTPGPPRGCSLPPSLLTATPLGGSAYLPYSRRTLSPSRSRNPVHHHRLSEVCVSFMAPATVCISIRVHVTALGSPSSRAREGHGAWGHTCCVPRCFLVRRTLPATWRVCNVINEE